MRTLMHPKLIEELNGIREVPTPEPADEVKELRGIGCRILLAVATAYLATWVGWCFGWPVPFWGCLLALVMARMVKDCVRDWEDDLRV